MTLSDREVSNLHAKPTHAVDILAFVEAQEIPADYFETPYQLAPAPGGEKMYALLRETLRRTRKIGIAYVVIHARQHLAALIPQGDTLVLNTLRWESEDAYSWDPDSELTFDDIALSSLKELELETPTPLLSDSMGIWNVSHYHDGFPTDMTPLPHHRSSPSMATEIMVEELDDIEEDEYGADEYLAEAFHRSMHKANAAVLPRTRPSTRNSTSGARYRGHGRR